MTNFEGFIEMQILKLIKRQKRIQYMYMYYVYEICMFIKRIFRTFGTFKNLIKKNLIFSLYCKIYLVKILILYNFFIPCLPPSPCTLYVMFSTYISDKQYKLTTKLQYNLLSRTKRHQHFDPLSTVEANQAI